MPRSLGANLTLVQLDEVNKPSDVNEKKKQLLKNGQTPDGRQSEPSNQNGSKLGAGTDGGQTKGGASPKSGGETDGNGARKPTKGASSQTTRKVSFCLDYDEEPEPGEVLNFISKGATRERIENALNRLSGVMLNAPSLSPRENELVQREILDIRDALKPFKAAVEAGEVTWSRHGSMRRITVLEAL